MCPVASGSTEIGESYKVVLGGLRGHCRLSKVGLLTGEAMLRKKYTLNTVVQELLPGMRLTRLQRSTAIKSSFSM